MQTEQTSAEEIVAQESANAQEAETVEAQAEAPVQEVQEQVNLSAHFAEIKRRDREIQLERQRLKDERAAMEAEKAGLKKQWERELLEETFGKEEPTEAELTRRELEELKAWKKEQEEARAAQDQAKKLETAKENVFTSLDASKHELLLASSQGKELLWNSIVSYCEANGVAPDIMEMADLVENQLLDEGKRLFATSKFKPSEPAPVVKAKEPVANETPKADKSEQSGFKTISNRMTAKSAPKMKLVDQGKTETTSLRTPFSSYMEDRRKDLLAKLNSQ
jgi:hypothetical protein